MGFRVKPVVTQAAHTQSRIHAAHMVMTCGEAVHQQRPTWASRYDSMGSCAMPQIPSFRVMWIKGVSQVLASVDDCFQGRFSGCS
jgi:hypothetical protein